MINKKRASLFLILILIICALFWWHQQTLFGIKTTITNSQEIKASPGTLALIRKLPTENPEQFSKDFYTNLPQLALTNEKDLKTLLTNPDKYADMVTRIENAKALKLKSVTVQSVKVLKQTDKYAIVLVRYDLTYDGIPTPYPNQDLLLMGKVNSKWYIESEPTRYTGTDFNSYISDVAKFSQQMNQSVAEHEILKKQTDMVNKYRSQFNQGEQIYNKAINGRKDELSTHTSSLPEMDSH